MPTFALTKAAVKDLLNIGRYTQENWGPKQRTAYLTLLDAAFHRLAEKPAHGKDCSDIREGYRKVIVGSHVIFYRTMGRQKIEIVRILHKRMDINAYI